MRKIIFTLMAAFISNFIIAQGNLQDAIKMALRGTEVKEFGVDDHGFNIKPITVVEGVGATGTISHCLNFRKDDQISYRIDLKTGDISYQIERGGFWRTYDVTGISWKYADSWGKAVEGSWEQALEKILNTIYLMIKK